MNKFFGAAGALCALLESQVACRGLGLREQGDIAPMAFLGGLEQALPHFGGDGG